MRTVRLALAIIVITAAWKTQEWMFLFIGGILLMQVILKIGCCAGSCNMPVNNDKELHGKIGSLVGEEIKNNNSKFK